jgi:hypothetical protein
VVPSIATRAVVYGKTQIVISESFVKVVKDVYIAGAVARNTQGGPASRVLDLMETMLRRRRGLPTWDRSDVETTLSHLAATGQIKLPSTLARAS